jgi:hypothetical protein
MVQSLLETDDFADSMTDATSPLGDVVVNGTSTGVLEAVGDRDWFRVQLTAGATYRFDLQGQVTAMTALADPFLRVYDSAGAWLAENDDGIGLASESDSRLTFTATITDTYYLEAGAFQDSYAGAYGVTVSLQVVAGDDFADSFTDTTWPFGQVSVDTPSTGNLEVVGDHDWFSIQLTANTSYTIHLTGAESGGGTLEDPHLRVYDSAGAMLGENDDIVTGTSHDSRLTYHVTATGTYYVEASAYSDLYTGTYRVSVAMGGVAPAGSDFNGDGFSDFLWQNSDGEVQFSELNGTSIIGSGVVEPNPGMSWKAIDAGDFNGDGKSDILWQNADGEVQISELNGSSIIGGGIVGGNPGPSWHAIGAGDFNRDGKSDILFQHTNGFVGIWELNGTQIIGGYGTLVGPSPGPAWKAVGTGDFNGDGYSDILFQHTSGPVALWELNGTVVIDGPGIMVGGNPGPLWRTVGTGDFNGDGKSDILFQQTSGSVGIWELDGTNVIGGSGTLVGSNPGPSWQVKSTGDYNNDGYSDILFQSTDGAVGLWEIVGTSVVGGSGTIVAEADSGWIVV